MNEEVKQLIHNEIQQGFENLTLVLPQHIKESVDGALKINAVERNHQIQEVKEMIEAHTVDETQWRHDFEKTMQPLITAMNTGGLLYRGVMFLFKMLGAVGASIAAMYAGYEATKHLWK